MPHSQLPQLIQLIQLIVPQGQLGPSGQLSVGSTPVSVVYFRAG